MLIKSGVPHLGVYGTLIHFRAASAIGIQEKPNYAVYKPHKGDHMVTVYYNMDEDTTDDVFIGTKEECVKQLDFFINAYHAGDRVFIFPQVYNG